MGYLEKRKSQKIERNGQSKAFDTDKYWITTTKGLGIILLVIIWIISIYLLVDLDTVNILIGK